MRCLGRFTCDWDPPAGHEWAGYPIRSYDAAAQSDTVKVTDPKKRRRLSFTSQAVEIHQRSNWSYCSQAECGNWYVCILSMCPPLTMHVECILAGFCWV